MLTANILLQLATFVSLQSPSAAPRLFLEEPALGVSVSDDSTRHRPRAIEIGDAYELRLRIHRYGSYTMLPLFAVQYALGSQLLKQRADIESGKRTMPVTHSLNRAHLYTGLGVGALFVSNTTTGLWNLYDNRNNPDHRGIRTAHVLTMLLADAGFVVTGHMGVNGKNGSYQDTRRHHNVAVASMGIATIGASMMWFFEH
jgi:hypothetical protein